MSTLIKNVISLFTHFYITIMYFLLSYESRTGKTFLYSKIVIPENKFFKLLLSISQLCNKSKGK